MSVSTTADLSARHIGKTVRCNGYQGTLNSISATPDDRYPIQLGIDERVTAWVKLEEPATVIGDQPAQPTVKPDKAGSVECVWTTSGYQCPRCCLFVCVPKREVPPICPRCIVDPKTELGERIEEAYNEWDGLAERTHEDLAEAVLALLPSRTEAEVEAEAAQQTLDSHGLSTKAARDVLLERARQISIGWTLEHDDRHNVHALRQIAESYLHRENEENPGYYSRAHLVKAAATLIAAIERLDRVEAQAGDPS